MSTIDELLTNNTRFAASVEPNHLDLCPSRKLAIVTCMDSRLDVFSALGKLRDDKQFEATTDFKRLAEADAIIICVPTPLDAKKDPDLKAVQELI